MHQISGFLCTRLHQILDIWCNNLHHISRIWCTILHQIFDFWCNIVHQLRGHPHPAECKPKRTNAQAKRLPDLEYRVECEYKFFQMNSWADVPLYPSGRSIKSLNSKKYLYPPQPKPPSTLPRIICILCAYHLITK